jgi:Contractile injection system tape measure protein
MQPAGHRIRRQLWQCRARTPEEAFALRRWLREALDDAVLPAFERAFDAAAPGDEMVRLPRLELRLRLARPDDLAAALPEALERALAEQLPEPVSAGPERRDRAGRAGSRAAALLRYLATGAVSWDIAAVDPPALRTGLQEAAREELRAAVEAAPGAAMPPGGAIPYFFRLVQLLPEESWAELARRLAVPAAAVRAVAGLAAAQQLSPYARQRLAAVALAAARCGPAPAVIAEALAETAVAATGGLEHLGAVLPPAARDLFRASLEVATGGPADASAEEPAGEVPAQEAMRRQVQRQVPAEVSGPASAGELPADGPRKVPAFADPERAAAAGGGSAPPPSEPPAQVPAEGSACKVPAEWSGEVPAEWSGEVPADRPRAAAAPFALAVRAAGLVLLHPFLPALFDATGLRAPQSPALAPADLPRAAALLWWLATGEDEVLECQLGLVKVLLGLRPEDPLLVGPGLLSAGDRAEGEALLRAATGHWRVLKGTGVEGLRRSFLARGGLLRAEDLGFRLQVEPAAFDLLLGHLPWGLSVIKLPWMSRPLFTEWPTP